MAEQRLLLAFSEKKENKMATQRETLETAISLYGSVNYRNVIYTRVDELPAQAAIDTWEALELLETHKIRDVPVRVAGDYVPVQGDVLVYDGRTFVASPGLAEELPKLGAVTGQVIASGTPAGILADPSGGETIDAQARTAIEAIIDALQAFGIIASEEEE
jgi:ribulose 1,5-bisphosphate carboxylase large subunit-like protein